MINLYEISEVCWRITSIDVNVRNDGRLIRMYRIGEKAQPEWHQGIYFMDDVRNGTRFLISGKINIHGDEKKNHQPEISWGLKKKMFPPELWLAEITHLSLNHIHSSGDELVIDIDVSPLEAEMIHVFFATNRMIYDPFTGGDNG